MDTICRLEELCVAEVQRDSENSSTFTCSLCLLLLSLKEEQSCQSPNIYTHARVHTHKTQMHSFISN